MADQRLGDVIDDFCVKCRRLTNHSIVSLLNSAAAKVRCRTCYSDHDYRNEQAPPSKKELARQKELYNAVLSGASVPGVEIPDELAEGVAAAAEGAPVVEGVVEAPAEEKPIAKKKTARKK